MTLKEGKSHSVRGVGSFTYSSISEGSRDEGMKGPWAQFVSAFTYLLKCEHLITLNRTPVFDDMLILLHNMAPDTSQPLQRARGQGELE